MYLDQEVYSVELLSQMSFELHSIQLLWCMRNSRDSGKKTLFIGYWTHNKKSAGQMSIQCFFFSLYRDSMLQLFSFRQSQELSSFTALSLLLFYQAKVILHQLTYNKNMSPLFHLLPSPVYSTCSLRIIIGQYSLI